MATLSDFYYGNPMDFGPLSQYPLSYGAGSTRFNQNYRPTTRFMSRGRGPESLYLNNFGPYVPTQMGDFTPSAGLMGEMQPLSAQQQVQPSRMPVVIEDRMAQENPNYLAEPTQESGAAPRRTLGLLGDMFGGASALDEYLTPQQRAQMQNQGAMAAAMQLLASSGASRTPIGLGQAIGQAYGAGQQGYQAAQQNMFQSLEMKRRLDEFKRVKELQEEETLRARQMRELLPQAFKSTLTPEQMTINGIPARVVRDDEGNIMPGAEVIPASRQLTIDPNKLQVLAMLSKNPLESLSQIAKLVPELRKAGFTGTGVAQENPFSVFTSDPTVPDSIKKIAQQYERSYSSGQMDPEKVDERVRQIGERLQSSAQYQQTAAGTQAQREQSAAQFQQTAAGTEANRNQLAALRQQGLDNTAAGQALQAQIAQQNIDLRKAIEANKPEQFSYAQKKDFDILQKNTAAATSADDSASIARLALPLIPKAYAGVVESGVKGLIGAVGISTEAKEANDRLTQLSQQLALKTPKFSGPTSDADAKRYDKAVGDLANPRVSPEAKVAALKDIQNLAIKQQDFAQQQENYFFANNKSLRGFQYQPANPFGK